MESLWFSHSLKASRHKVMRLFFRKLQLRILSDGDYCDLWHTTENVSKPKQLHSYSTTTVNLILLQWRMGNCQLGWPPSSAPRYWLVINSSNQSFPSVNEMVLKSHKPIISLSKKHGANLNLVPSIWAALAPQITYLILPWCLDSCF